MNSLLRKYIDVNRKEQPNICEILDLLLDRVEKLEERVQTLEDYRAETKERKLAAARAIARNATKAARRKA